MAAVQRTARSTISSPLTEMQACLPSQTTPPTCTCQSLDHQDHPPPRLTAISFAAQLAQSPTCNPLHKQLPFHALSTLPCCPCPLCTAPSTLLPLWRLPFASLNKPLSPHELSPDVHAPATPLLPPCSTSPLHHHHHRWDILSLLAVSPPLEVSQQIQQPIANSLTDAFLQMAPPLTALPPPTSFRLPFPSPPAPSPPLPIPHSAIITAPLPPLPSQSLITVPLAAYLLSHPAPCSPSPFHAPCTRLHRPPGSPSIAFPCCSAS